MQSQNYYENYRLLSEKFTTSSYSENKIVVDSLAQIMISKNQKNDLAKIYSAFSVKSFSAGFIKDAIYYASKGIEQKKDFNQYDEDYVILLFRLGFFYSEDNNLDKSVNYYEKVIKLNLIPKRTGQAYCQLALYYFDKDDFYKSIQFFEKGISILEKNEYYKILLREYINLFIVYAELDNYESLQKAKLILKKAENLNDFYKLNNYDLLKIYNAYTVLYQKKEAIDYNKASYYARKNIELAKLDNKIYFKCTSYINLAKVYNKQKKDSAFYFASESKKYCTSQENLSKSFLHISRYFDNQKNPNKALKNIQKGINILLEDENDDSNKRLNLSKLQMNNDKDHLLYMIYEKIKLLNQNKQNKLALQHTLTVDSLIDNMQENAVNETKLHWRLKASEIYTQGVQACYTLNKPETAFYLSEKGKALLLTEAITKNRALAKLPDSITNKILEFKKTLTTYKINKNKDLLFENQLNYKKYIDSLKTKFPSYFKNKSLQNIVSLDSVKKALDNSTIVVSYFWPNTDEETKTVFALFVTKEKSSLLKIGDIEAVNNLLANYREVLSKPFSTTEDKNTFNKTAYQLYNTLLKPQETAIDRYKNILVIPDGNLHNVPFGALTKDKHSLDYLIKHQNISYAYSLSFLDYNNQRQRTTKQNFIGFAPQNFEALKLNSLKNSVSELEKATSIVNGDMVIDTAATKAAFFKTTEDAKIIHLATHAEASENPWIAFSDKKLSLEELYNYKNNAELTVLSGCETSIGEIATGEGVMSLARGFFYSGSNAVVASLWNVDDKSTSIVIEDFYKNLKVGKTKSEALRLAKLNYIETHSLSEASPYYWSSFVLLGDINAMDLESGFTTLHYFIIGFILLTAILLVFKKKKK